jgi:site-specific DNA-methyltransferase (cytosine-N4-specific)
MKINSIIQGDTLEVLKAFPDDCIDTIITSPPYWGLRDYGEETKIIWDGDKDCKHEWNLGKTRIVESHHGQDSSDLFSGKGAESWGDRGMNVAPSGFCPKCGAWYGQLGLEPTLEMYLNHLLQITMELKRVLKPTGVMFWNQGDCYGGSGCGTWSNANTNNCKESYALPFGKNVTANITHKCMVMQNYRLILRMIDDEQGWILRNTIIWHKPNHMPSSVKDRFASSYEPVFMLVKNRSYWFDLDAVRVPHKNGSILRVESAKKRKSVSSVKRKIDENIGAIPQRSSIDGIVVDINPSGKNPGDVWTIPTQPFPEAHFATFPEKLVEPMVKAGCPKNGIVLDPFAGAGTTCVVAKKLGRNYIGIELNPEYCKMAEKRISEVVRQGELNL